ncbi:hypothetical protein AMK21_10340 [Streptomyces sp. CB00316]|nr:hypothetical protein AMK21_10340 [Streptomyces sp. CB00316]
MLFVLRNAQIERLSTPRADWWLKMRVVMCGSVAPAFARHLSAPLRAPATSLANVSFLYGRRHSASSGARLQVTGRAGGSLRGMHLSPLWEGLNSLVI